MKHTMIIPKRYSAMLALLLAVSLFPPGARGETADDTLGKVGEQEVKVSDIRQRLDALTEKERDAMRRDPAALNQFVRSLLVQQLLLRKAAEKDWEKSPEVAERMKRLREGVVANTFLESVSQPPESFPNEAELTAAYEANKDSLLVPKSWRLAQIYIVDPKGAKADSAESKKAAAKLAKVQKALLADKPDFAALAKSESEEGASAKRGGEIGWLAENQIQPAIRDALPKLALEKISEPIRMDDGWHIIKVLDIREPFTPTLDQIRGQLAKQIRAERARSEAQAYLAKLLQESPIAINEMVLPKLMPPPEGQK